jgi:hypothetical protein
MFTAAEEEDVVKIRQVTDGLAAKERVTLKIWQG